MAPAEKKAFIQTVKKYYTTHGRHDLLWRKTTDPYHILVSEVMLQQTQVERVLPKYQAFLKSFPTVRKLAAAPLSDVLRAWQGLGYNRRAKMLHQCAQEVVMESSGIFPETYEGLLTLPGVGPYTTGAVLAFAFNKPVPIIETNIRTVYLHHFFKDDATVPDTSVRELVAATLDTKNPREWYWGLMDYGSHLKSIHGNPNKRSKHYAKQSKFIGSDRQVRGAIVKVLVETPVTLAQLKQALKDFAPLKVSEQLEKLLGEEMVERKKGFYQLPS